MKIILILNSKEAEKKGANNKQAKQNSSCKMADLIWTISIITLHIRDLKLQLKIEIARFFFKDIT